MRRMASPRVLAFAQLVRLPNVFTAFADIALAACVGVAVTTGGTDFAFWLRAFLLALASGCLYTAGMVWNDYFDFAEDSESRPFRPLPSGRVTRRTAVVLGVGLMLVGLVLAGLAGLPGRAAWTGDPLVYALALAVLVLLYDGWLKRTPLGPVAMASCRFFNVLLGLSVVGEEVFDMSMRVHVAGVVGVYIVGVTWFARTEEGQSRRKHLGLAAGVMVAALALALVLKSRLAAGSGSFLFPYLLVAFGFFVGVPAARAIQKPGPREVQAAVKRCVLGLVALDAVLATAFVGLPGLAVLLLLPPALVIGKWVYST